MKCSGCGTEKPQSEFYNKHGTKCRTCCAQRCRTWRKNNLERAAANSKRWRINNPEKHRAARRRAAGIPEPTRPMPTNCECCGALPKKKALAADHNHRTGIFRGWLCLPCNVALGMVEDSCDRLLALAFYLRQHHGDIQCEEGCNAQGSWEETRRPDYTTGYQDGSQERASRSQTGELRPYGEKTL